MQVSSKASEYRRLAADCVEVAKLMSLRVDRERVLGMAQRWLDLAQSAEKQGG
jgi:hypothetical protein